ncbi:FkbM family methyltransferase [Alphaproteobacteria bacterium]|nr:FkbM family methyltransferase [Alphaproteobacteria bacterium]
MSEQAIKFKASKNNSFFQNMSLSDLQKLPPHNGILNFKISRASFLILNILNDDSSAVKYFWKNSHDVESLDLWYEITANEGTYIDVGAHTGLYTLTALKANSKNHIICLEPYYMNLSRLITNLRLNNIFKNVEPILGAVSDFDGKAKFKITTEKSYMSKGGKIDTQGLDIDVYRLDTLYFEKLKKKIKGLKIDTEGEDYKVLMGAKKIIEKYKPEIIIEVREENKILISNFLKKYSYKFYDVLNLKKELNLENYQIKNIINLYAKI